MHIPSTPPASSCFQLHALRGWLCLGGRAVPGEELRRNPDQRLKQVAVFLLHFFCRVLREDWAGEPCGIHRR